DEEAIGKLHDIGFVDGMNLLAADATSILEGPLGDAGGSLLGGGRETLDDAGNNLVLDAGVESLGVLTDHDEIDTGIASRNVGKIADRAEVGEELKALAKLDVDAGESSADWRSHRTFESDTRALDGFMQGLRNVFLVLLVGFRAGFELLPLELDASGFEHANGSLADLRANSVARDERYLISSRHKFCNSVARDSWRGLWLVKGQ